MPPHISNRNTNPRPLGSRLASGRKETIADILSETPGVTQWDVASYLAHRARDNNRYADEVSIHAMTSALCGSTARPHRQAVEEHLRTLELLGCLTNYLPGYRGGTVFADREQLCRVFSVPPAPPSNATAEKTNTREKAPKRLRKRSAPVPCVMTRAFFQILHQCAFSKAANPLLISPVPSDFCQMVNFRHLVHLCFPGKRDLTKPHYDAVRRQVEHFTLEGWMGYVQILAGVMWFDVRRIPTTLPKVIRPLPKPKKQPTNRERILRQLAEKIPYPEFL